MDSILSTYFKSFPNCEQIQFHKNAEIAFAGRSNVGKSSLINAICCNKHLAKTSQQPGKTQLLNFFESKAKMHNKNLNFFIVDLPGYGYAKLSKLQIDQIHQMVEDYLINSQQLKHLFLLIDARHNLTNPDKDFLHFFNSYGKNYSIIFTKTDKLKPKVKDSHLTELKQQICLFTKRSPNFFESGYNLPTPLNLLRKHILQIVYNTEIN
ncbi:MAG: ribosome biogenesis GTP-binding protein YihA/YsxC [Sediminibacterium sp.]|nr:ribosome biogenesis GTP-binding protein YihA/YsxC [Sediminibacterium sp.]